MYEKEYKTKGLCQRCGAELTKKQKRWCSPNCSRLGLKREYKQRNHDKILEYNRNYRRASKGVMRPMNHYAKKRFVAGKKCEVCGTKENLNVHHIVPRRKGGTHAPSNLKVLCFKHHMIEEKKSG